MELELVSPKTLQGENNQALLNMHYHMTMLHKAWEQGKMDINIQQVKRVHDLIVDELDRRGIAKKSEHLTPIKLGEALATVHPSGEEQGEEITLDDLPEFGDFYLNDRFILLVGSLPNNGKTKNDLDFLIAWPEDTPDEILRPITFRLWRQFPVELQSRCSFHLDRYHGPFTNSIPLYRLKCERINPEMEIIQAGVEALQQRTLIAQAEASKREDKLVPMRFFYSLKTGKDALVVRKKVGGAWEYDPVVEVLKKRLPQVVEKKNDGMRMFIFKDGSKVWLVTEDGQDVTHRLLNLEKEIRELPYKSLILDTEIEYYKDGVHQPREDVASSLLSSQSLNEEGYIANIFEILLTDGEDIHKEPWTERRKVMDKFPAKNRNLEYKPSNSMLNVVPSYLAETEADLKKYLKLVVEAKGSEGAVTKSPTETYALTGTSTDMMKSKKYATIFGIVQDRVETKTPGVYNYDYAVAASETEVDPDSLVEIDGKRYSKAGTSYSTTEKLEPGDIFKVSFHTMNKYTDPKTGKISVHFYEPVYDGKEEGRKEPSTIAEAEKIAKDAGLLNYKEAKQDFKESEELSEVAYSSSKKLFAKNIVSKLPEGLKTIFDPMCGTGSVLIEAARKGYTIVGNDLNPFASRFAKGIFEGEKLNSEDIDLLSKAPERPGWFTKEYRGQHPTDMNLRTWVDSLVQHVEENFKDKKLLAARAVVCSLLGKFFRGTHTAISSGYFYQDREKSKQMLQSAVSEVNRLIEQVGGKGTITEMDAFGMEIPKADVIFYDPPNLTDTAHRHALSEYKTRNSILLQKPFEYTAPTKEGLRSLLEKLSKSAKVVLVCSSDGSEIDWEEALKEIRPKVSSHKLLYFRQVRNPQAMPSVEKSRSQTLFLAEADPYLDVPSEEKEYKFAAQHHWRGKSTHADLRLESKSPDELIGWTIDDLLPGTVDEPVLTMADAKEKEANQEKYFKINWKTGEWAQRLKKGATKPANVTLMAQQKAPEPIEWVDFTGVIPPGEVGSTKNFPGVLINIDRGTVEYGAQKPWSHEYFFDGKALKGKYVFRQLESAFGEALLNNPRLQRKLFLSESLMSEHLEEALLSEDSGLLESLPEELFGECLILPAETMLFSPAVSEAKVIPPSEEKTTGVRWFLIRPVDQTPYVLTSEAVKKNWMPPAGHSALPKKVRQAIPAEYKYWALKDSGQAKQVRDSLYDLIRTNKIKLPLVETRTGRYALKYHWYSKKGEKPVRLGATEWHFDLFLMNGKQQQFHLDYDPLEADETSAYPPPKGFEHSSDKKGEVKPGEPGNPSKETGSWIEDLATGRMIVLDENPLFMKVRFFGKLDGVWTFDREAPSADFWHMKKSQAGPTAEGGAGSGNLGHAGRPGDIGGSSSGVSKGATKSLLAKKSYKPATRAKQQIASKTEKKVAKLVGGEVTPDNSAFDVRKPGTGIEVKTIVEGKNPKITMHPESLKRKKDVAKKDKLKRVYTVVHDVRGGKSEFYVKEGLGSFRLASMRKVSEKELVEVIGA